MASSSARAHCCAATATSANTAAQKSAGAAGKRGGGGDRRRAPAHAAMHSTPNRARREAAHGKRRPSPRGSTAIHAAGSSAPAR